MDKTITLHDFNVEITGQAAEIEHRFLAICQEMNRTPIHISRDRYDAVLARVTAAYTEAMEPLVKAIGPTFRCNASADCVKFFKSKGANLSRLTASGKPQMDQEVLHDLARSYPEADLILTARGYHSVLSQLKKWAEFVKLGVVQPTWHQFGTPMGRLSCEGVALQNRVPEVRETVVPEDGYVFVSCDIGQMEYRQWASLSGDVGLRNAFAVEGKDFHTAMGEAVGKYLPAGTDLRKAGKTINFALLYRMSAPTLASQLGVDVGTAEEIMRAYFSFAFQAEAYAQEVINQAKERGRISTYFGRARSLPDLRSEDPKLARDAMKTAWHHHNAGTAADVMKWIMNAVDDGLIAAGLKDDVRWVINLHDQFVLEVKKGLQPAVQDVIRAAVKNPVDSWVSLEYELTVAENWAEL